VHAPSKLKCWNASSGLSAARHPTRRMSTKTPAGTLRSKYHPDVSRFAARDSNNARLIWSFTAFMHQHVG
jgi:hypothetical protein